MALIEPQAILRDHIKFPPKRTEGFSIRRVCVTCSMHIRSGLVDGAVDGKCGRVDGLVAFDDVACFVDEDEV